VKIFRIAGGVIGAVLFVIGFEYLLIYVFDVDARILKSLKFIVPIIVAIGLIIMAFNFKKSKTEDKEDS